MRVKHALYPLRYPPAAETLYYEPPDRRPVEEGPEAVSGMFPSARFRIDSMNGLLASEYPRPSSPYSAARRRFKLAYARSATGCVLRYSRNSRWRGQKVLVSSTMCR